ncbi:divinyl chlorophyllide a 8-vinyl- chloroplastic [Chlorella sorokiniana]|uniref:Divinyl chlorophyllide a 8-vinyl-chloroplastic n=1 Tax=Chlorella sorokiniana TaxID=3076 RepID=A0A2P6TQQ3_CHLSO|nr:divinyl chlorophyllide a 8-vinyl- chloroplastic [Chlorella sorokiniana]|eukprot:PRW56400.1 divinyl chlorophyllide a 8-vinyl- chloroplastic [Chlorella sorokiniana]
MSLLAAKAQALLQPTVSAALAAALSPVRLWTRIASFWAGLLLQTLAWLGAPPTGFVPVTKLRELNSVVDHMSRREESYRQALKEMQEALDSTEGDKRKALRSLKKARLELDLLSEELAQLQAGHGPRNGTVPGSSLGGLGGGQLSRAGLHWSMALLLLLSTWFYTQDFSSVQRKLVFTSLFPVTWVWLTTAVLQWRPRAALHLYCACWCLFLAGASLRASSTALSAAAAPARQQRRRALAVAAAGAGAPTADFRQRAPADVRVLVVGATGYIGKFVVKELVKRGYNVVAFARERSGIGGKQSAEDVRAEFPGADVRFGDVMSMESLSREAFKEPVDVVVSCLASRTGGIKDSWDIDYQATLNAMEAGRKQGASHFVLLSAICVQKPLLEFQRAKLAFEEKLQKAGDITYSIVRPTAFFKSLAGQVDLVKEGKPYVMFGDGTLAACKPISEQDLAAFIADCVQQEDKVNQVLPIGGPGKAMTAKDQADLLFGILGKKPYYFPVPVALMDGIIGLLDLLAKFFPGLKDGAEFGKIGKYYAVESMLLWDPETQQYLPDATPSYGKDTLEDFFRRAIKEGLKGQELGDQAVFGVNKETGDSQRRRLVGQGSEGTPTLAALAAQQTPGSPDTMFRPSRSGAPLSGRQKLEARHSDPLDQTESGGGAALEWEREPILNLVTAVLSNCVLGFPFCFKMCGMGLALLLVLVTLAAAELSMRLLLMSAQLTGKRSYDELARHAYGRVGNFAVHACIVAMNVGSVVSYLLILTDTVSGVAGTVIPPGAEPSRHIMLALCTFAGCLPVALFVKSAQLLNAVNNVSMAFLLLFCAVIALLPFSPTPGSGQLHWWRWEGMLVAFPIVSYGFTAHQYLFQIYPSSQKPSLKKMTAAMQRGMALSALVYVAVGACGYSAFGSRTSGDVLRNFGGAGASGMRLHAEKLLKYGFGVSLLGAVPLTLYPLHDTFAPWLALCSPQYSAAAKAAEAKGHSAVQLSQLQDSMLTAGIMAASYSLAVLLPNVEFVFGLAGSTASTLMAFILPAAIFLRVSSGQRGFGGASVDMLSGSATWRQRRRMAGALLLFGCVAGVLCTHAIMLSIQEEAEVVQLAQELVREETKVVAAAQAEAKAKEVVEVVGAVAAAKQEVESMKAEASGQAQTLARAAQALNSSVAADWRDRQQQKGMANTELQQVHQEVDRAVAKLENMTANLGATASRIRNDTATKAAAAGGGEAAAGGAAAAGGGSTGAAAGAATAAQLQQQQRQQQQQPGGAPPGGAGTDGKPRGVGGSAAHEGVVRAAEAAVERLVQAAVGRDAPPAAKAAASSGSGSSSSSSSGSGGAQGGKGAAEALEAVASTANETLTAVKQSKVALEAAAAEAATVGQTKDQARELGKAITNALNATTEAQVRLNATTQALTAVEQEKTSELLAAAATLAKQAEREEEEEQRKEKYDAQVAGRKEGLGLGAASAPPAGKPGGVGGGAGGAAAQGSGSSSSSSSSSNATAAGAAKPRQEARETLKAAAAVAAGGATANVSAVNVTAVAQATIEAASGVVASSKEKVEETIERKKPKVTERAIEIAKELFEGGQEATRSTGSSTSGNGTAAAAGAGTKVSVIETAAAKHEQRAGRTPGNDVKAAKPASPRRVSIGLSISKMSARGVKLTNFYGQQVPRPYVLLDDKGDVQKGRVDPPVINDALIEWAQKVPVKQGGTLVKPEWDGPKDELPKEARNDFQIFFEERWEDILAANPALFAHGLADRKALLSAASIYWRERLTNEERAQYRQRAAEEKKAAKAALEQAEQSNPKFKAFRNKMQKYKEAMHSIVSAARASTGPLWRAQRLMNAKYRQLEAEEQEREQEEEEEEEQAASGSKAKGAAKGRGAAKSKSSKAGSKGGKGGRGKAAPTDKALVDSDSESSDGEDWDEEAAAAADAAAEAAEAMQKLLLATAKKDAKACGKKAAGGSAKKKAASRKAAAAKPAAKQQEEEEEEVLSSEEEAEQQAQGARSRSGAARLAAEKAAAASKGRRGYVGAYELPPSQNPTPAKAGRAGKTGKAAAEAAAAAAAMQALKSPGKRTRGGSSRQAAVAEVAESPAKKQRRAPARRG